MVCKQIYIACNSDGCANTIGQEFLGIELVNLRKEAKKHGWVAVGCFMHYCPECVKRKQEAGIDNE